ncbi:hypothetical protein AVEN_68089-1 [Araneus ventricosus]|uniref:Tc1-like transposase DDE domain-containing protein n=1 Tax=Araneus ventricosus TaxID=182803 RepID=A0A4Y2N4V2_ARAVE|nr:hypothetical protein AVEN_68089-1 [Araneus ventricosus]
MSSDGVILLHDNIHTARKTQEFLPKYKWEVWNHPRYSPDLAPNLSSKHLSEQDSSQTVMRKQLPRTGSMGRDLPQVKSLRGSPSLGEYRCPNPEVPRDIYSLPVYPPLRILFFAADFCPSTASKGALHQRLSPLCFLSASHGQPINPHVERVWRPIRQVRNSLESTDKTDGATVEDNNKLFSTMEHEPMATDHKPIHSNDSEIEAVTAIEYNPHETIDKSHPVVEQQPSTSSATIKKSSLREKQKIPT